MSVLNYGEYFRYAFFSTCLIATIAMNVLCVREYLKNDDIAEIDFKTFNSDDDLIYPSVSVCIINPFIQKNLNNYGKGIDAPSYRKFLLGDYWDPRMLYIDYDNVTVPLIDNLIEYGVQYPNYTWNWYNKERIFPEAWNTPYISYRNADVKCFAMDISYRKDMQILRFGVRLKSKIFHNEIRPQYKANKQGFAVYLHYPQQFVRSYFAGIGKWNWQSREDKKGPEKKGGYAMDIMIQNINVIIRRDKPRQAAPCDGNWLMHDNTVWKKQIIASGCRHPLWKYDTSIQFCSNKEQLKKAVPPDFEDIGLHPVSCRRIEKLQFDYNENDLDDETRKRIKGYWFELSIRFGDSIYKEITKVRKFDYQSLIGKPFISISNTSDAYES